MAQLSSSIISRLQEAIPNFQDNKQATAALLALSKLPCLPVPALQFPLNMHYCSAEMLEHVYMFSVFLGKLDDFLKLGVTVLPRYSLALTLLKP